MVYHKQWVFLTLLFENYPSRGNKVMQAAGWLKDFMEEATSQLISASRQ